jgi:hypothetical protein
MFEEKVLREVFGHKVRLEDITERRTLQFHLVFSGMKSRHS